MLTTLRTRRSIRKYQDRPLSSSCVEALEEAVLRAPSSRGLNPLHHVFVQDKDMLEKLALAKPHGGAFLKNASLGVVVCADPSVSDVWVEDAAIASFILHMTAHTRGLGSCWIQVRKRMHTEEISASEYIRTCLHLPEHLEVEAIIAIGYPDENKTGHPKNELLYPRILKK